MKSTGCAASLGAADFVDHRDVRMVERRGRARLGQQPRGAVAAGVRMERLQRDDAPQAEVLGAIHVSHAPGPEPIQDAIVGERLAGEHTKLPIVAYPLRREDHVAVGVLDAEFAHAVELILERHHDARLRFHGVEERVDPFRGSRGLDDHEQRIGAADRACRQAGQRVLHRPGGVEEHLHVIALEPHEDERGGVGHGRDDREAEHVAVEREAAVDVGDDQVRRDVGEFHDDTPVTARG